MNRQALTAYEAPVVEVIEVEVERGFAVSSHVSDWNNGGSLGDHETE